MKFLLLAVAVAAICILAACKQPGCTDSSAYNWESSAGKDDGSCKFSRLYFYTTDSLYPDAGGTYEAIDYVEVRVDNQYVGQVHYNPSFVNCTGLEFVLDDGEIHEWAATVFFVNTETLETSGDIEAGSDQCIGISVTP